MKKIPINTDKAPKAIGPYEQAVQIGNLIFSSGQLAIDPENGTLLDSSISDQTKLILTNLENILISAGSSLENVVKTTIYLINMESFAEVNEAYSQFFPDNPPARSTVCVSALPLGAIIEIEAVAYI